MSIKLRPHTSCRRGKRVRIVLFSGDVIIGKFNESSDKYVFLEDDVRILKKDIKAFGIYKQKS